MAEVPSRSRPDETGRMVIMTEHRDDLTDTPLLLRITLCSYYIYRLPTIFLVDFPSIITSHCIIRAYRDQDISLGAPKPTEPRSPLWRRLLGLAGLSGSLVSSCGLGLRMSSFVLCRRLGRGTESPHSASCNPASNKVISQ